MEEKYEKRASGNANVQGDDDNDDDDDDDDSSSSDETEDEAGFLATEALDTQISATLQAIRNKDPRVYDKTTSFYKATGNDDEKQENSKGSKAVYLQDYHREKLMRGDVGASDDEQDAPQTYTQEQEALKQSIMSEINAANDQDGSAEDYSDDEGFMKRKAPAKLDANGVHPTRAAALQVSEVDVANANKSPDTFLSNFLAARAWVPEEASRWKAFESDEEEEEEKADQFEQAYNMRFEDPEKSNEFLKSYARDIAASRSVRREEKSKRKRHREVEREKKEEERTQRREEKSRLKKLKLEEAEGKLALIRQAAGATGKELTDRDWISLLNDSWENGKWDEEMQKRFGDDYYAVDENLVKSDEEGKDDGDADKASNSKRKRPKKPKWDDDINIKDIVPDFEDGDGTGPNLTLSDAEEVAAGEQYEAQDSEGEGGRSKRKAMDHKRARLESQKKARQQRSKLEALVDARLGLSDHELLPSGSSSKKRSSGLFRYREVSPQAFGMTSRDILLAPSDQALNDFAGLKKLATFRDEQKKRRDRKRLGKKARLRQWRKDFFGKEFEATGPTYGFEGPAAGRVPDGAESVERETDAGDGTGEASSKKKKRKRSRGKKSSGGS